MSALRISRPGIAGTTLIPLDDGASPRIDRARSGISFTPLTEAIRPFTGIRGVELRPKATEPRKRSMTVIPRCGRPVMGLGRKPTGEACYRRPGHSEGCRDRAAVERDNARRRARDYGTGGKNGDASSGVQRS